MIATVIQRKSYEQILALLDDPWIELAEIRLDLCDLSDDEIEDLFGNADTPLIATCRADLGAEAERRLTLAIRSGARFADLEIEAEAGWSKRFRELCHECGTEIIRSYHDFEGTPSPDYLQQIVARCYRYGADIAKIVTTASGPEDIEAVLGLYGGMPDQAGHEQGEARDAKTGRLIAFAMGEAGRQTRLECLKRGAPFTYASLEDGLQTASGQIPYTEMHRLVYGGFRGFWRVGGDLPMPCSKSFAQRAILCAAIAEGRSHLYGYTPCEDSESAISVARALGATVRKSEAGDGSATLMIDGIGTPGRTKPESAAGRADEAGDVADRHGRSDQPSPATLHTGESGLLTRLCIPLMAAVSSDPVTITGEKTLLQRPLKGVQNVMASFGVPIRSELVPITVTPPLIPGNAEISGADGSQIISGLLTALPLCKKNSTIYISEPKSIPYMFITQDILKKFGVRIKSEMEGDERLIEEQDWSGCSEITFNVKGGQNYKAANLRIEGDWSAAANFLVAGAIFGKAEVSGLSTDSLQADLAIADILVQAGAAVSEVPANEEDNLSEAGRTTGAADESCCNVCVSKAPLEGFEADLANSPDLFPICAILAAFCDGQTVLHGVDRLHGKESDRAAAIMEMLSGFGVAASIDGNDLYISGETLCSRLLNGRLLKGGNFSTRHDHRMAMAIKIASMGAAGKVTLDDPGCVAKSFPSFWEIFDY